VVCTGCGQETSVEPYTEQIEAWKQRIYLGFSRKV
jgi:hypothetical protein